MDFSQSGSGIPVSREDQLEVTKTFYAVLVQLQGAGDCGVSPPPHQYFCIVLSALRALRSLSALVRFYRAHDFLSQRPPRLLPLELPLATYCANSLYGIAMTLPQPSSICSANLVHFGSLQQYVENSWNPYNTGVDVKVDHRRGF